MKPVVLAIDDDEDIHDLVTVHLRNEEIELHHATEPLVGLRKASELAPDLVLLDVDMPQVSGFQVCAKLKSEPLTAGAAIVFLTGQSSVDEKVRGLDLGATDYVTKPFDRAELCARVRAALRTKRYQDMLAQRARIDALTGLGNRAGFDARLSEELAAWERYERPVSLVLADIDHFKAVNDQHGHPAGDRVLRAVADALVTDLRETDFAFRFGGEEFAIVLRETTSDGALVVAERARLAVEALELRASGQPLKVTISLGVADTSRWVVAASDMNGRLVHEADAALYAAKRAGRNRTTNAADLLPPRALTG